MYDHPSDVVLRVPMLKVPEFNKWYHKERLNQGLVDLSLGLLFNLKNVLYDKTVIAGGAPREWFQGRRCADVDYYYVSTNPQRHTTDIKRALNTSGMWYHSSQIHSIIKEGYGDSFSLHSLDSTFPVDFVGFKGTLAKGAFPFNTFDYSICCIGVATVDGTVECSEFLLTTAFLVTHYTRMIYQVSASKNENRKDKFSKYPDYTLADHDSVQSAINSLTIEVLKFDLKDKLGAIT